MLKRAALVAFALLISAPAPASEMESPIVTVSGVNWDAAAASLSERGTGTSAEAFARLNASTEKRFAGIAKSAVPVLLPFDVEAFGRDMADGKPEAETSDKYFGDFHPTKFFLPGPAGYDATFTFDADSAGIETHFRKPVEVEISGAAFVYALDGPSYQEESVPNGLEQQFPGIRRVLRDSHVRYVFTRFGVPYVLSIQCYDRHTSSRQLSCRHADPVAVRFLRLLQTAGGSPEKIEQPKLDISRPAKQSDTFTYFSPGDLIEKTGWNRLPGRADYHVYARMRFPIADAPAYVKSQSFMPWGNCYRTGISGHMGSKGAQYRCRRNDKQLVFDELAPENFTYPWRDNFCEVREYVVGQCPGGYGHQGEDIRPATCVMRQSFDDRCLPYQHNVAAAADGLIRRMRGDLAAYLVVNNDNEHVRFRYLHMNPKFMDADELFNGRHVSAGEIIGKVATWGDYASGTSYHLHFNIQVFTNVGWVWVNPYMTLVAAYERLIGERGVEIPLGEPEPPVPDKPPVLMPNLPRLPAEGSGPARERSERARSHHRHHIRRHGRYRHHRPHRRRHRSDD